MGKSVAGVMAIVAAGALGVYFSLKNWEGYETQARAKAEAVAEMRKQEAEKAELRRKLVEADSPAGREKLARDRGYTRPWEVPVQ